MEIESVYDSTEQFDSDSDTGSLSVPFLPSNGMKESKVKFKSKSTFLFVSFKNLIFSLIFRAYLRSQKMILKLIKLFHPFPQEKVMK